MKEEEMVLAVVKSHPIINAKSVETLSKSRRR